MVYAITCKVSRKLKLERFKTRIRKVEDNLESGSGKSYEKLDLEVEMVGKKWRKRIHVYDHWN